MKTTTKAKRPSPTIHIALYGARHCGYGTIVSLPDGRMLGDGEPAAHRGANDAVWLALDSARTALGGTLTRGSIAAMTMDTDGGSLVARFDAGGRWPYFGELRWERDEPAAIIRM